MPRVMGARKIHTPDPVPLDAEAHHRPSSAHQHRKDDCGDVERNAVVQVRDYAPATCRPGIRRAQAQDSHAECGNDDEKRYREREKTCCDCHCPRRIGNPVRAATEQNWQETKRSA